MGEGPVNVGKIGRLQVSSYRRQVSGNDKLDETSTKEVRYGLPLSSIPVSEDLNSYQSELRPIFFCRHDDGWRTEN